MKDNRYRSKSYHNTGLVERVVKALEKKTRYYPTEELVTARHTRHLSKVSIHGAHKKIDNELSINLKNTSTYREY